MQNGIFCSFSNQLKWQFQTLLVVSLCHEKNCFSKQYFRFLHLHMANVNLMADCCVSKQAVCSGEREANPVTASVCTGHVSLLVCFSERQAFCHVTEGQ